jgi:hypothetical protein
MASRFELDVGKLVSLHQAHPSYLEFTDSDAVTKCAISFY